MCARPLVTVVIPVRDGEPFVDDALVSALGQTYRHLEVIVVDDGSRDGTRRVVEARMAQDPRVRLLTQTNLGVAAARNRAIAEANGEFIAPLDADDFWDPTKIERQVQRMLDAGEGTGLVYCWWTVIDRGGLLLDRSPRWSVEGRASELLLEVNYTGNASVPLFRRRILDRAGGYDPTLRDRDAEGGEDWDLALKVAEQVDVAVVPAALVAYRRQAGSMSSQCARMWRSHLLVVAAARRRQPELPSATIRRAHGQFALHLAGVSFWSGSHLQAVRWVLRAMPSSVVLRVLPYIVRLVAKIPAGRARARGRTLAPGTTFWNSDLPEPLIPYDRLYPHR